MAKDKISGLTDKQERFCQEFIIDMNATQAALRSGYSGKTAHSIGAENLTKPEIQSRLTELKKVLSEKVSITQEMVLNELAKVGFSNLQDYFEDDLSPKSLSELSESKGRALSSIKKTIVTYEGGSTETVEFKLHDKIKSLELLGKHLGFFEKDNKQGNTVFINPATPEQLKEIADKLKNEF
jgi:phage terminase small subunit